MILLTVRNETGNRGTENLLFRALDCIQILQALNKLYLQNFKLSSENGAANRKSIQYESAPKAKTSNEKKT
jgi:hypothetical protein